RERDYRKRGRRHDAIGRDPHTANLNGAAGSAESLKLHRRARTNRVTEGCADLPVYVDRDRRCGRRRASLIVELRRSANGRIRRIHQDDLRSTSAALSVMTYKDFSSSNAARNGILELD